MGKHRFTYGALFFNFDYLLHPDPFFNKNKTDDALDNVDELTDKIQRYDIETGIPCQHESQGDINYPYVYAVEKESDPCFSSGAQGEIGGMHKGV